jgi:glycosyltransferase involved in cell wall biosynthesis
MRFSYILAYRMTEDRDTNLKEVLNWLSLQYNNNFEVLLVEQDKESKIDFKLPDFCKHIFLYNESYFNKSWAYNVGALNSSSDILIFADTDILIDFNNLLYCVELCEDEYDSVDPKGRVLALAKGEKNYFNPSKYAIRDSIVHAGGLFLISKIAFFKVNGWDEDMMGWGGEDDLMSHKISASIPKRIKLSFDIYHIYHRPSSIVRDVYDKNLSVLRNIRSMGEEALYAYYKGKVIGDSSRYKDKNV